MDQDFHYYGTYYAARKGGFSKKEASLIAKASNFVDFFHNGAFGGYWTLVRDKNKLSDRTKYKVVGEVTNPRYTFQDGLLSTGMSPEDGLWCSFHFTPGNYHDNALQDKHTPSIKEIHGDDIEKQLPAHLVRAVADRVDAKNHSMLNRPLSPLSRAMIKDTLRCMSNDKVLEDILLRATGGWDLLTDVNKAEHLRTFKLLLLGIRSHVLADTWAHQDFSGITDDMNTYWDIDDNWGRQAIKYKDVGDTWHTEVLSSLKHENLQATPNGTSYLGHGWMGHFPDFSFVEYQYRPCWQSESASPITRNNPVEYKYAWIELCSLFTQSNTGKQTTMKDIQRELDVACSAISASCVIADSNNCPRAYSATQWQSLMKEQLNIDAPEDVINAAKEPDPKAVLSGLVDKDVGSTRYGTYYVDITSDLYLFHIAADYHFHFIKNFLSRNNILEFTGSWSTKMGPLSPMISDLFDENYQPAH